MSKKQNKQKGDLGEEIATKYLIKKGYKIIKRNFRCKFGEIDIIAKKGNDLVFVEVKTKTSDFFGVPEEMVDYGKLKKINDIIDYFLCFWKNKEELNIRIDVVAVELDEKGRLKEIRHIENFEE